VSIVNGVFTPVVIVAADGTITTEWADSFLEATVFGEVIDPDDTTPYVAPLDARLGAIRSALRDAAGSRLADLVKPFFVDPSDPYNDGPSLDEVPDPKTASSGPIYPYSDPDWAGSILTVGDMRRLIEGLDDSENIVIATRDWFVNVGEVLLPDDWEDPEVSGTWTCLTLFPGTDFDCRQI
jgi:hypothetical protein